MIDNSKIIILILSTNIPEYQYFKAAIQKTWLQDFKNIGIKCFFYEGDSDSNYIQGDVIKVKSPDDLYGVSHKLVEALKVVFEIYPKTQLIYRTNLSSYIDVQTFMKYIHYHNFSDQTYAGVIGTTYLFKEKLYKNKLLFFILQFIPLGKKLQFASGAGFFLGAIHCRKIISTRVNLNLVDDIMVAHTIKVKPLDNAIPERLLVSSNTRNRYTKEAFNKLVNERLLFHYRFKTINRNDDAIILSMFGEKQYRESYFTSNEKNIIK